MFYFHFDFVVIVKFPSSLTFLYLANQCIFNNIIKVVYGIGLYARRDVDLSKTCGVHALKQYFYIHNFNLRSTHLIFYG